MLGLGRKLRKEARKLLFAILRRALATDDGREIFSKCARDVLSDNAELSWLGSATGQSVSLYPGLGIPSIDEGPVQSADAIFITGRFRSGSTLLWNIFRQVDGCTAYYEPFNERRWFDAAAHGDRVDPTHLGVSDYWREYAGLNELGNWYDEEWTRRRLYMESHMWMPRMKRYIEILIERSVGRPVLQFNRVDFRLPWLRRNFPNAFIVHLYRHPRDQWCSTLVDPRCFGPNDRLEAFEKHDKYYLQTWVRDLRFTFPFLDDGNIGHPYEWFYYIWKLSYLFGIRFADRSIAFEGLLGPSRVALLELLDQLGVEYEAARVGEVIQTAEVERWRTYASDEWFRRVEAKCEDTLAAFLASDHRADVFAQAE